MFAAGAHIGWADQCESALQLTHFDQTHNLNLTLAIISWAGVLRGCGRPFLGRFSSLPRNGYRRLERFRPRSTPDFFAQRWPP